LRILGVGIATLDIINRVASYPQEDDEIRALDQQLLRGGNATNTLVVLSQLGHDCHWAGSLADEPDSQAILDDLARYHIDTSHCMLHAGGKVPTSYVTLSAATGSRTIIHHRDLPEYPAEVFAFIDLSEYDWVHFEGRNVADLKGMLERTRQAGVPCSLEVEKPREGIEVLFELTDLLLFSRVYARHAGYTRPDAFLATVPPDGREAYCAWGELGAWVRDSAGDVHHAPAIHVPELVDTLGAGDVFNAAVIDARVRELDPQQALLCGCQLAGRKCAQQGLAGLCDDAQPL
jgi:ketohexokinase